MLYDEDIGANQTRKEKRSINKLIILCFTIHVHRTMNRFRKDNRSVSI